MEDLVWLNKQAMEIIESNRRALELYSFVWSALEDNQIAASARGLIIDPCSHNIEGQAHALVKTIVRDKRGVLMWSVLDTILTSDKLARHYKRLLQDIEFIAEDAYRKGKKEGREEFAAEIMGDIRDKEKLK